MNATIFVGRNSPKLIGSDTTDPTVELTDDKGSYVWMYFRDRDHLRDTATRMFALAEKVPSPEVQAYLESVKDVPL